MNKHLTDKEMVNDVLASTNASLTKYASVISETANPTASFNHSADSQQR